MDNTGMDARYDEDYFLRGQETGKSLYKDYRWLPDLTIPMAERIIAHLDIELTDRILDFGCARGYLVRALLQLGHINVTGVDVSEWALKNADPKVKSRVSNIWPPLAPVDWIIAKDVLEHIALKDIGLLLEQIAKAASKGVFIVVPLASQSGFGYVVKEYEEDVTHALRWTLSEWVSELHSAFDESWEISARYRIQGIKDNYAEWALGNGFLTCRKIAC